MSLALLVYLVDHLLHGIANNFFLDFILRGLFFFLFLVALVLFYFVFWAEQAVVVGRRVLLLGSLTDELLQHHYI